ncbi:MAG: gamma-glutamyl-gamma-aminobutyrate hydrolase family protein [Anaerolineales bacterium]|nr:gamma-glutamyl-gamma-aminobutyrate hydrolase family protein [Anaerolineales bacterium]
MLVYVDLEHQRLQQQPELWEESLARRLKHKYRLEELSGDLCLMVRYDRLNPNLLRELQARAVIVSGCHTDFERYSADSLTGLRAVYREAAQPVLGLCAGMQLLAEAYGAEIGPLGPLAPGEADPYQGAYLSGVKQERGFMPVKVNNTHRLFAGLPAQPTFFQAHYWEVKALPASFRALAETDLCRVQAIAHRDLPLFGVQFHPEEYDDAHPDGRKVLENFLAIVGEKGN